MGIRKRETSMGLGKRRSRTALYVPVDYGIGRRLQYSHAGDLVVPDLERTINRLVHSYSHVVLL